MFDPFPGYTNSPLGPYSSGLAILPSDTVDLPVVPAMVWCGSAGDLRVTLLNGETVTIKVSQSALAAGYLIRATRIFATGTTAADIVLFW